MTSIAYTYAAAYLQAKGWTYSGDIEKLASRLEDCCQDYVKELEEEYEEASHDRRGTL